MNETNYTEIIKDQTKRVLWSINNVIDNISLFDMVEDKNT